MAECPLPKPNTRVRFPSSAPEKMYRNKPGIEGRVSKGSPVECLSAPPLRPQAGDSRHLLQKCACVRQNEICLYRQLLYSIWGRSSAGRAMRSQRIGHGFESHRLHHQINRIRTFIRQEVGSDLLFILMKSWIDKIKKREETLQPSSRFLHIFYGFALSWAGASTRYAGFMMRISIAATSLRLILPDGLKVPYASVPFRIPAR